VLHLSSYVPAKSLSDERQPLGAEPENLNDKKSLSVLTDSEAFARGATSNSPSSRTCHMLCETGVENGPSSRELGR
jgi:hypothetical protein